MAPSFTPLPYLLACVLAACSTPQAPETPRPEPEVCPLAPALECALGWSDYVVDCGALERAAPSSEWQRARACVLAAHEAGIACKLSYEQSSYDSLESAAFATRGRGQPALRLRRSSVPSAPWRMQTSLRSATCSELRARIGCTTSVGELCLECVGERPVGALCEALSSLAK